MSQEIAIVTITVGFIKTLQWVRESLKSQQQQPNLGTTSKKKSKKRDIGPKGR